MRIRKILSILLITLALAGCTLAPAYTRPTPLMPSEWKEGQGVEKGAIAAAPPKTWCDYYLDGRLRKIIDLTLKNNRDLRVAVANVEKARSLYGIKRADLLPTIAASGGLSKQRLPSEISATGSAATTQQYSANLGITAYEIDLFGRVRSLKDQALEQYLATDEARRSVEISLIAEVANAVFALGADQELLRLSRDTLQSQEASYGLIERRFLAGASSELDLRQNQTRVETAKVDLAFYNNRVVTDRNALNILVGSPVPAELYPDQLSADTVFKNFSMGLFSETLLNRPDILQAEHLLKAAHANIGAARAAFFPRISLTTALGTVSTQLYGLFGTGSETWTFAPQATIPIFDTGRNWANLGVAKADREIYLAQYEKAIMTAFKEVSDTLSHKATLEDQLRAQDALVKATADTYRLSTARYNGGIDSYLPVLDAQRSLYSAQQRLIALRLEKLVNMVSLYRVLGGSSGEQCSSKQAQD